MTIADLRGITASKAPSPSARGALADQDDVEGAGAVDAFDAVEFDVAGGGGAGDPGCRAVWVEAGEGLGEGVHDLVGCVDDADVVVGDEGEDAAALVGCCVEDEGAGFGDG